MINVQVAFQGGGAKFVNMLAVAEVLEAAHDSGKITITRVAGTSAGSIVACLLASGTGIPAARDSLKTEDMQKVARKLSGVGRLRTTACIVLGIRILSIQPLLTWLTKRLQGTSAAPVARKVQGVTAMRKGRPMELIIVSSDLMSRGSRRAAETEDAVTAVSDSCAIPFVFRTWRGIGYRHVDGGLCSNLPVDFLLDKVPEEGEVLAVSFEAQPTSPHNGRVKFLMALLDTAISSGEEKARSSLPKANVLPISTDLTTMDFDKAVSGGLGEQYLRIRQDAAAWLQEYLDIRERARLQMRVDPWADQSATSAQVMTALGTYFEQIEKDRFIEYRKARLTIIANSLRSPSDIVSGARDSMELELEFATCDKTIHMMALSVTEMHPDSALDTSTLSCRVKDASEADVLATLIPMRRPSAPKDRHVCVCYSTPLPANSGPYKLKYRVRGTNFMRNLQLHKKDEVAYYPTRARGALGTLELVLQVPEDFAINVGESGRAQVPRKLNETELPDDNSYGMKAYGFVAKNVEKCDDLWHMDVSV